MIKSLIKRLKVAIGFKEQSETQSIPSDEYREVPIPLSVTRCIHCGSIVVLKVFKKEEGAIGRRIKIRCAQNCLGWALEMPNTDDRNRRLKKALGYLSTYYETHK